MDPPDSSSLAKTLGGGSSGLACVYHLAFWFAAAWAPRCLSMLTAVQQYSSAAGACVPCVQVVLAAERTNLPKVSPEGMLHTLT